MESTSVGIPVFIAIIWLVNLGLSFWNARQVGLVWAEAKAMGGLPRFIVWCGAIMAYCGFLYCYAIIEAFIGNWLFPETVTPEVMKGVFALSYLVIIFPVLGTGFAIWATSLYQAWVNRDFRSIAGATWNTLAQVHNTYSAFRGVPQAWSILGDIFGGKSSRRSSSNNKGAAGIIVVLIVVLAAILAFITTAGIIMKYAGTRPLPTSGGKETSREPLARRPA